MSSTGMGATSCPQFPSVYYASWTLVEARKQLRMNQVLKLEAPEIWVYWVEYIFLTELQGQQWYLF